MPIQTRSKTLPTRAEQNRPPKKKAREEESDSAQELSSKPKRRRKTTRRTPARKFRHITEGAGGTYTIDPEMPFIGTSGCYTCLGVYFAIDDNRCFFAHINIEPQPSDWSRVPETERSLEDYVVKTAAERSIIWWVKKNLNEEAWKADWGPVTGLIRNSLVLICPKSGYSNKTLVGDAALSGVKEFLGIDDEKVQPDRNEGVIITHTGAEDVEYKLFDTLPHRWEAVEEPDIVVVDSGGERRVWMGNELERGDQERPVRPWEWSMVTHDGQAGIPREGGSWEGPYHVDAA